MLARLDSKCPRNHQHQPLLSGRAHAAELYPDQLILELLRGMRDDADKAMIAEEEETQHLQAAYANSTFDNDHTLPHATSKPICAIQPKKIDLTYTDGRTVQHTIGYNFKDSYSDEHTREILPQELIEQAM